MLNTSTEKRSTFPLLYSHVHYITGGKKTATTQQLPLQKLITTRKGTGYSDSNATTILPKTSLTPHRTTFQDCSRCPTPSPVNYPTRLPCPSCASCPVYPTCSPCPGCPDIPTPSPCTNELQDCSRCPTPSPVDCNCPQPTPSPCHDCPVCTTCSPCPGCRDPPTPAPQALPIDMMPFGAELEGIKFKTIFDFENIIMTQLFSFKFLLEKYISLQKMNVNERSCLKQIYH